MEYEEEGFSIKMLLNGAKSSALNDGRASRRSRGTGDACLSPVTRLMISEQICGPRGERIQRVLHPLQIPHSIPHLLTTEQGMTCKKNYTTGWGHRHRLRETRTRCAAGAAAQPLPKSTRGRTAACLSYLFVYVSQSGTRKSASLLGCERSGLDKVCHPRPHLRRRSRSRVTCAKQPLCLRPHAARSGHSVRQRRAAARSRRGQCRRARHQLLSGSPCSACGKLCLRAQVA